MFNEEPDNMFEQFEIFKGEVHSEIKDNPVLMELVSMQRWFIFQKVDDLEEDDDI